MLGDIGIFLRTKKVSFPSCWGIGHFLKAKKASLRKFLFILFHPVGELAPFSWQRPAGEIGIFSWQESFFSILSGKFAPFLWQRKFLFHPAGEMGTFLVTKKV
jgi:hypothetical protein